MWPQMCGLGLCTPEPRHQFTLRGDTPWRHCLLVSTNGHTLNDDMLCSENAAAGGSPDFHHRGRRW